jgi:hypothetical protein
MSDQTTKATRPLTAFQSVPLPLVAGGKAVQGCMACIDVSAGVARGSSLSGNANLVKVGVWTQSVDNSAGTTTTQVMAELDFELWGRWFDNATGGAAVAAGNLFSDVYILDNHTVGTTSSGNSKAGRAWELSPDGLKVLVETYTL